MNIAQKEAWLWRYQEAVPRLNGLEEELDEELEIFKKAKDKKSTWNKINRLQGEIEKIKMIKKEIAFTICRVEKSRYRSLLYYRYLEGLPWRKIANRLLYSDRYIYKLHKKALEQVELYGTKRPYRLENHRGRMQYFDQEEKQLPGVVLVDESTLRKVGSDSDG